MFGAAGDRFISAAIAISTFGFLNLAILAPTRVYYAMAADRVFVPALATLHPRFGTPGPGDRACRSTWSCVLALTGTYDRLLNYVVFADWIFFGLTVSTLFAFRRQMPARAASGRELPRTRLSDRSSALLRDRRRRRPERRARRSLQRRDAARC